MQHDCDDIMSVYSACAGMPGCTWTADYPTLTEFNIDMSNGWLYCLKQNDDIIGVVSLGAFGELDDLGIAWSNSKRHCELARIGVRPWLSGKGIGTQLLRCAIEKALEKGFDSIRIIVSPHNKPALALYRRAGFKTMGKIDMYNQHWFCQELVL